MRVILVAVLIEVAFGGPCDPGSPVVAPFPGVGSFVQATVISQIIDGAFIVEWFGSPELCSDPSARGKCIVEASLTYNQHVCLVRLLLNIFRVFIALCLRLRRLLFDQHYRRQTMAAVESTRKPQSRWALQ